MVSTTTNLALPKVEGTDNSRDYLKGAISGGGLHTALNTLDNALLSTLADAKGDLLVGTAADTIARKAVGANNTVLVADSGQATGVAWSATLTGLTLTSPTLTNIATGANVGTSSSLAGANAEFQVYHASGVPGFSLASARSDADAVGIGQLTGVYATNSASHKNIAQVTFASDGGTANQRGGRIELYTKPNASTTLTKRGSIDQAGVWQIGQPATTGTAAAGEVVLANAKGVWSANAAGSATVRMLVTDSSNRVIISDGTNDILWAKPLVALGGGAAATLGTIGGSGPATAGQNTWMRVIDTGGNAFWVPAWK